MKTKVLSLLSGTIAAIVSLHVCRGTLPSGTIEQAEKTFKNTRTQGFYYRTIPSDESLTSSAKHVFMDDFLTPRHLRKPNRYFNEWHTLVTNNDLPKSQEHNRNAILRSLKQPRDRTSYLYMTQLLNRNGNEAKAENAFKNVFASSQNSRFAEYSLGDGKNVHGTIVAAETKLKNNVRKGAYLVFMESEKSLKKEIKETQEKKKKDMEEKF